MKFIKEQEARGLLSNLAGIKLLILSDYINEIINKLLLAGDKFMSEMHLKQPEFTCSPCGPFLKIK